MDEDDENYVPYVPVAKRKQALVSKLTERKTETPAQKAKREQEEREEAEDAEKEEERRREKARKERTLLEEAQDVHKKKAEEGQWWLSKWDRSLLNAMFSYQTPKKAMHKRLLKRMKRFSKRLPVGGSSSQIWNWLKVFNTLKP